MDSSSWDALLDYIKIAWGHVRSLPIWDNPSHNNLRQDCFKVLTTHTKLALKNGGSALGVERIKDFKTNILMMSMDFEEIACCKETLIDLIKKNDIFK